MADLYRHPGTPRWAKVQATMVAALLLMVVAMASGLIRHGGGAMGGHGARWSTHQ